MKPPYQQPGAEIAFWTLVALFVLGEYAMRFRSRSNGRGARRTESWSLVVIVVAVAAGLVGGFRLADSGTAAIVDARRPVFLAGLVTMAAGIVVRQWAILTLGRFFTVDVRVRSDQTVVTGGPYRWVRHPSYTGLLVFFVGLGLALTDWGSLILLAVLPTAGLVMRIHSEERALLAALGEPYREYAATRRRLIPGVW